MQDFILPIHAGATLFMTGLIWLVQVVHYPLFRLIGAETFSAYESEHQRRILFIVGPVMSVELVTGIALLWLVEPGINRLLAATGLLLILLIWFTTAFLQAPCHRRLVQGCCQATIRRLVVGNWIRTIAWSARAPIVLALLAS